jgi:hypothetical protein
VTVFEIHSHANRDVPFAPDPSRDRARLFGGRYLPGDDIPRSYRAAAEAAAPIEALREAAGHIYEAAAHRIEMELQLRWADEALRAGGRP